MHLKDTLKTSSEPSSHENDHYEHYLNEAKKLVEWQNRRREQQQQKPVPVEEHAKIYADLFSRFLSKGEMVPQNEYEYEKLDETAQKSINMIHLIYAKKDASKNEDYVSFIFWPNHDLEENNKSIVGFAFYAPKDAPFTALKPATTQLELDVPQP